MSTEILQDESMTGVAEGEVNEFGTGRTGNEAKGREVEMTKVLKGRRQE